MYWPFKKVPERPSKVWAAGRGGSGRIGSDPGEQPSDERENIDAKQS